MKRFLKNNRYQLDMREQEEIWRGIQQQTGRGELTPKRPRLRGLPVFGLTTLTAAVLLVAVWFNNQDAPEKIAVQARNENPRLDVQVDPLPEKPMGTMRDEAQSQPEPIVTITEPEKDAVAEDRVVVAEPKVVEPAPRDVPEQVLKSETSEKFAIESVEEALSKQAGVVPREGELFVRGGRSRDVDLDTGVPAEGARAEALAKARQVQPGQQQLSQAPIRDEAVSLAKRLPPPAGPGSVTGGTTPPNGETFELMYFEHAGVNPFVATEEDALSTFAVDVDNASYTLTRSYLQRGALPPKDAIRVEEFVNFFDAGYREQTREVFAIHTDGAPSRFGSGYQLLRVGLKGMHIDEANRKPANLIFVIDISGSMARENRLGLVKQSLHLLLDELSEGDRVGIVVYGNRGEVLLEPTDISRRARIQAAIDALGPSGATNACEGLEKAYALARSNYDAGVINRLILCSDGVANMGGTTRAEEMLATVRRSSDQGITLSTVGFGMGNYNDVLMEKLANQGDGNYHYVDQLDEAKRVFRQNLTGLLQTIAREVKIQVEFDPRSVQRWRLLGYENRDVADRDFRNDSVDAGEVGAGHEVTALYELKLIDDHRGFPADLDGEGSDAYSNELGTVRVRYEYPAHDTARAGQVKEIEHAIKTRDLKNEFGDASGALRLQAVAAEFAEILRGSFWAKESQLSDLVIVADGLAREMPRNQKAQELAQLIRQAADLQAKEAVEPPRD